ncbi:AcrR family transcriptional regulator [Elusimicrobium posterum]|uniref:TetR/AcrR family transcriptional regulator n=1 Tax=Elusimicrobium posterum TaxID=3116653 RepID=UPI003C78AB9D
MKTKSAINNIKNILEAARWCFLNFGYGKTSMEDVAKRANVSRALIYKKFKNKEEIALGVFDILLTPDYKKTDKIAAGRESKEARLMQICQIMALEPWAAMAGAPMAEEFLKICELIEPQSCTLHEKKLLEYSSKILGKKESAQVFVLALYGLQADVPPAEVLEKRVKTLVRAFTSANNI